MKSAHGAISAFVGIGYGYVAFMTDNNGFSHGNMHPDNRMAAELSDEGDSAGWDQPGRGNVVGPDETDPDRRDLRADIGKHVSLSSFPATAGDLVELATANQAPDAVLDELRSLAPETSFATTRDLWIALDLEVKERF
jgi:hypothetical protein